MNELASKIHENMKRKYNMIILGIIAAYLVFLFDFQITYTKNDIKHEVKYQGLIWVALDYYTIIKYRSSDEPKKWISYKRRKSCG